MRQFQTQRRPADAETILPPPADARALYPTLDTNETRPVSLPPVAPVQWPDLGAIPEQPSSPLVPAPVGQRPKVVEANPARLLIEIAKRAGGLLRREEPAPPPPVPVPDTGRKRDASPFTPTDQRDLPPIPSPSPVPSPEPPRLPPTPDKSPELPKTEGFVPPDLKNILKPLPGGDFTIPPGGSITLPGTLPDDIPGILVLTAEMLHGEQKGGVIGKVGRVEEADLTAADPMYGRFKKLAERAAEIVGPGKGPERGKSIHKELDRLIEAEFTEEERKGIRVEYTANEDGEGRHGEKGRPRVDIYRDIGNGEARIYELKTGSAREKAARVYRLFNDTFFGKITRATVTEIWVP